MRDLHGGRIGVAVYGNDFDAEALQLNDNFLPQLPTAAHHNFGGARGEGSPEYCYGVVSFLGYVSGIHAASIVFYEDSIMIINLVDAKAILQLYGFY
jgi:hypothetical protein